MAKNLTDDSVRKAFPGNGKLTEYRDAKVPGLALRVTPASAKSWTIRYRLEDGSQRRLSLGTYPAVTLSKARDRALAALTGVAAGNDPASEKKKKRDNAVAARRDTIEALGERYFQDAVKGRHRAGGKPKRQSTLAMERYYFDRHVLPEFGPRPVASLTRAEIQDFINRAGDEHAPSTARQCRVVLQRIFSLAQWQEITDKNPCQFIHAPDYMTRERVLSDGELRIIWAATAPLRTPGEFHLSPGLAIAIRLAMVTLQRRSEIVGLHSREINRGEQLWTIPGERTKNGKTHLVPLSATAIDLIELATNLPEYAGGYLFPSPRDRKLPVKPGALTLGFSRLANAVGLEDAKPHDLRRSGATLLTSERIGVSRFIVSAVLNHTGDKGGSAAVTAIYDRNTYMPEKRRALEAWSALLSEIANYQTRGSNVISFNNGK